MRADIMTITLPRASAMTCRKTPLHVHVCSIMTVSMVGMAMTMTSQIFHFRVCDLRNSLLLWIFIGQVSQMRMGRSADAVAMTMTTAMFVEETKADQVDHQAHRPHPQDQLGVVDRFRLVEPLQALDRDGEAECDQEDCVHQGTQHLCTSPAKCVLAPRLR